MQTAFLGIGTNLGEREDNLCRAISLIEEHIGRIIAVSSVYETEPWGFKCETTFLNMAIQVETGLAPSGLLGRILMVEAMMGRLREGKGYKSRIMDIDILLYGNRKINNKVLEIPHPRLHERRFVLVPLTEIAGEINHPELRKTISELLEECKDESKVINYKKKSQKTAKP